MNDQQMDQGLSSKMWYIIGAVVVIALAFWYFSASPVKAPTANTQTPSDNTTAAISADLNQTSDGSAELDQAAAASAQAVQGF
ncbi:MAG: hypothetical protein NTU85_02405 [Candidatus Kaiserbacteria bacterium]|nr:hypothetical protein [Candidatus Kaiserbacteria bacterium]